MKLKKGLRSVFIAREDLSEAWGGRGGWFVRFV